MNIAIITGASSGMGREFVSAVDKAYTLDEIWVIARREERLRELQSQCRTTIRPLPLDLLDRTAFTALSDLLKEVQPSVNLLINAAGFGLFGTFTEMNMDEQLDIISRETALTYADNPEQLLRRIK